MLKVQGSIFQFHKGAIRTSDNVIGYQNRYNFNSIKVRLEPESFVLVVLFQLFQFHKGAIRTKCQNMLYT